MKGPGNSRNQRRAGFRPEPLLHSKKPLVLDLDGSYLLPLPLHPRQLKPPGTLQGVQWDGQ